MTIFDKAAEYGNKHDLFNCDVIIIGCSGGPDSLALTEILSELKDTGVINAELRLVHVNHNLRPDDCMADQKLVEDYARSKHLPLKVFSFDVAALAKENRLSEETQGRKLRYQAFSEYKDEIAEERCVRIATAHHMDDLAETMLMNLFRGSGLKGLIAPRPYAGDIIRPLLCLRKAELISLLDQRGIAYARDFTNELSCCTRNVWRNEIIPKIAQSRGLSDDPIRSLYKANMLLEEDSDFIEKEADKAYEACRSGRGIRAELYASYHKSIRTRVLRRLWLDTFGHLTDLELVNTEECDSRITGGGNTVLDMPFNRKFITHEGYVLFAADEDEAYRYITGRMGYLVSEEPVSLDITDGLRADIGDLTVTAAAVIVENGDELEYNNYSWFYPLNNKEKITIANALAQEDDLKLSFAKAGSSGSKKISRIFTDLKIPKASRKNVLYVRSGDRILWIPGFGHSEGFTSAKSRDRYKEQSCETGSFIRLEIERRILDD